MPSKASPPYPAFNHLGTQIRDKWRRIDDKMRHGTAPAMRSRIIQSRDKFEAFVKDIDLYHANGPQPVGQPKRNRLHEADARTRSDILSMLQGLDTILATGIYMFGNLESLETTARTGAYSLPSGDGTVAGYLVDRIENGVNCMCEYASCFKTNESTGVAIPVAIPEERLEPTRSSRSLREWLRDIKHRLPS